MLNRTLPISSFQLNKDDKPIYQQIVGFLMEQITSGMLAPDTLLPGTRELSRQLNINRQTVIEAYDRLINTGWLYTQEKKGTFVAPTVHHQTTSISSGSKEAGFDFNEYSFLKPEPELPSKRHYSIKFDDGKPDPKMAPVFDLVMAYKRSYSMNLRLQRTDLTPAYTEHSEALYELDKIMGHYCGVKLNENRSCFILGIFNALYFVGHALLKKGDAVVVENPGDPSAWEVFQRVGAELIPVEVDEDGLSIESLKSVLKEKRIKAVYVTPQVQVPTTVTLSAERRAELLELAHEYKFAILEADYDYEFWYDEDRRFYPLLSQDRNGSVIYLTNLSKTMPPLSWISVVTGPSDFIRSLKTLTSAVDHQGELVLETAVTQMMKEGTLTRCVRKSLNAYKKKRDLVVGLLDRYLENRVSFTVPNGGLSCWLKFNEPLNMQQLHEGLQQRDVYFPDVEVYSFFNKELSALRFGFASLDTAKLETGIKTLASVVRSLYAKSKNEMKIPV